MNPKHMLVCLFQNTLLPLKYKPLWYGINILQEVWGKIIKFFLISSYVSSLFNLFLSSFSPNQLLPCPLCSLKTKTSSLTINVSLDPCPKVPFHTQAQLGTLSLEVLELYLISQPLMSPCHTSYQ